MKWLKGLGIVLIVIVILVIVGLIAVIRELPQVPPDLNMIATSNPTVIYADDDQLIKALTNRQVVPISDIPQDFINAVLALEDPGFYKHSGINKKGIIRAMVKNLLSGSIEEGGSSITQQLVKNIFFTYDRTWSRKIKEVLVALQVEQQFTKDQILEAYINHINFGSGIFGVEMAAQTYFSKHADELTLTECALLAGIPRSPNRYNPYRKDEIALERLRFVLKQMFKERYIDADQLQSALNYQLTYQPMNSNQSQADYYVDYILQVLGQKYDKNAIGYGGVEIHTTMNTRYQYNAKLAVEEGMKNVDKLLGLPPYDLVTWEDRLNYPQAALVAIDTHTGAIKALIGGRDYRRAPFNRAASNNRMPGSSFKVFTYLAALDKGFIQPNTVMVDEPVTFHIFDQVWEPRNFEKDFDGPMTMKWALCQSRNVIAAKLIDRITPQLTIDYAHRMGITSDLEPNLSLALGATSVSPIEMANAYATIADGGIYRPYFSVKKMVLEEKTVFEQQSVQARRVVDPQTIYQLLNMMQGVVEYGTAHSVRDSGFNRPCAGKTGTTNDYRDAWFIGFTPDLVCAVWVGYDDNRSMYTSSHTGVTGAMSALPIWLNFMKKTLETQPYTQFVQPPGIYFKEIDPNTGSGPMPGSMHISVALRSGMKNGEK